MNEDQIEEPTNYSLKDNIHWNPPDDLQHCCTTEDLRSKFSRALVIRSNELK